MKKIEFIMLIDDDFTTNHYHKLIVEEAQVCEKYVIYDMAKDALEYFKEEVKKENPVIPNFLFLDINMPEMNGWRFLEEYEKLGLENPPIIIMLTTSMNPSDEKEAEKYEMIKDFVYKPLRIEYLNKLQEESL